MDRYNNFPKRKPNRLKNFDYSRNGIYFVTICTSDRIKMLSNIVRSLKILVTKQIGKSIFQRSFHDHIIRDEADYLKIWNYIDTNPAKWQEDCFYIE